MLNKESIKKLEKEEAYYFVNIKGISEFESYDFESCKEYLKKYLEDHMQEINEEKNYYDYYIGMFSICMM